MARLACAAMQNETLMRIASTKTVTVGGRAMTNHNRLLSEVDGCLGLKTGYTRAAGRTLVSCVRRNGRQLVAVTLQDGNDWADHAALFEYGFSEFSEQRLLHYGQTVTELPVIDGLADSVAIVTADSLSWPIKAGETLSVRYELPAVLAAPVRAGTAVGTAVAVLDGVEVARTALLCGEAVAPALPATLSIFHRLRVSLGY